MDFYVQNIITQGVLETLCIFNETRMISCCFIRQQSTCVLDNINVAYPVFKTNHYEGSNSIIINVLRKNFGGFFVIFGFGDLFLFLFFKNNVLLNKKLTK